MNGKSETTRQHEWIYPDAPSPRQCRWCLYKEDSWSQCQALGMCPGPGMDPNPHRAPSPITLANDDIVTRLCAPEQWQSFPGIDGVDGDAPREAAREIELLRDAQCRLLALLREVRNTRATDIAPDGWADRVDTIFEEIANAE